MIGIAPPIGSVEEQVGERSSLDQRQILTAAGVRWSGMGLLVGGYLIVLATLLHPSEETPRTILQTEPRLVGSHAVYIASYLLILLGLPALYSMLSGDSGITGRIGYLTTFVGTALLAIPSQLGFIAPVLAADAPAALEEIIFYWPVVFFNAVAAITFIAGDVALGMAASASSFFARWSGYSMAIGAPVHLVGSGIGLLGTPALWFVPYSAVSRSARVSRDAVIACGLSPPVWMLVHDSASRNGNAGKATRLIGAQSTHGDRSSLPTAPGVSLPARSRGRE
jgi:hypothetical protein